MTRYVCQCGGVIEADRPPPKCPHCGARIGRVRTRGRWLPGVVIGLLFAALLAFVFWLLRQV